MAVNKTIIIILRQTCRFQIVDISFLLIGYTKKFTLVELPFIGWGLFLYQKQKFEIKY